MSFLVVHCLTVKLPNSKEKKKKKKKKEERKRRGLMERKEVKQSWVFARTNGSQNQQLDGN